MDTALGRDVFVYIDDVLIATDTKERLIEVLRDVLEAMNGANLKLKSRKWMFREKVAFLGHEVDKEGVHADPAKIEKIQNYPQPTTVIENLKANKTDEEVKFPGMTIGSEQLILLQKKELLREDGTVVPVDQKSERKKVLYEAHKE
ncbi:hypothetical protein COOONC_22758 [Cooperia oncophora]